MKLSDILLLGVSAAFLIIGIDQWIFLGFEKSYWAFMVALIPFFIYTFRKARRVNEDPHDTNARSGRVKGRGK